MIALENQEASTVRKDRAMSPESVSKLHCTEALTKQKTEAFGQSTVR